MELYSLRLEARVVTDPGGRRLLTLDVARIQPKRCAERQVPHTKGAIPAELDIIFASTGSEVDVAGLIDRSEEHTSELQSLMRISYAVFCLKKKKTTQ